MYAILRTSLISLGLVLWIGAAARAQAQPDPAANREAIARLERLIGN